MPKLKFFKPEIGSGNILDDKPVQLPDTLNIPLADIIVGSLNVTPQGFLYFVVTYYKEVENYFKL